MPQLCSTAEQIFDEVFSEAPLERSFQKLVLKGGAHHVPSEALRRTLDSTNDVMLKSLAFYYLDMLPAAHELVQNVHSEQAAYVHGMIHRREGDFSNASYWFAQAKHFADVVHQSADALTSAYIEQHYSNPDRLVRWTRDEWISAVNAVCNGL